MIIMACLRRLHMARECTGRCVELLCFDLYSRQMPVPARTALFPCQVGASSRDSVRVITGHGMPELYMGCSSFLRLRGCDKDIYSALQLGNQIRCLIIIIKLY